jgi:hypothetical protein
MARTTTKAAPIASPALTPTESSSEGGWVPGVVDAPVAFDAGEGESVALANVDAPVVVAVPVVFDPPNVGNAVVVVVIVLGGMDLALALVIVTGNSDVVK